MDLSGSTVSDEYADGPSWIVFEAGHVLPLSRLRRTVIFTLADVLAGLEKTRQGFESCVKFIRLAWQMGSMSFSSW